MRWRVAVPLAVSILTPLWTCWSILYRRRWSSTEGADRESHRRRGTRRPGGPAAAGAALAGTAGGADPGADQRRGRELHGYRGPPGGIGLQPHRAVRARG